MLCCTRSKHVFGLAGVSGVQNRFLHAKFTCDASRTFWGCAQPPAGNELVKLRKASSGSVPTCSRQLAENGASKA